MDQFELDLINELLAHRRRILTIPYADFDSYLTTYGSICNAVGAPERTHSVGRPLGNIAKFCQERDWPPLNALVVNSETRMPGHSYDSAPGCDLLKWPDQVKRVINFEDYAQQV